MAAIEFLSNLRHDVEPELYEAVDNVIHQLLSLPTAAEARTQQEFCVYKAPQSNNYPLTDSGTVKGLYYCS